VFIYSLYALVTIDVTYRDFVISAVYDHETKLGAREGTLSWVRKEFEQV